MTSTLHVLDHDHDPVLERIAAYRAVLAQSKGDWPASPRCDNATRASAHVRAAGRVFLVGHPEVGTNVCDRSEHQADAARWVRELTGGDAVYEPFEAGA
jgi:hypothetical protein